MRAAWVGLLLVWLTGCNLMAPIAYYLRPPQIRKPLHKFPPDSTVLLLFETQRIRDENPVFERALFERARAIFREHKLPVRLIGPAVVHRLRREHAGFSRWSVQRIGREAGADFVIYVRADRLVLRESPGAPVLTPRLEARMKVIDVHQPAAHARVWPDDPEGYAVQCTRPAVHAADPQAVDRAATKLGRDAAWWITAPFVTIDQEKRPPVEP